MAEAKMRAVARRSGPPPEAELGDDQLLERCGARGDDRAEAAFATLIRRHGPMVLRVCGQVLGDRHDAEDAFQACFLVLARKSGSIRRPDLLGNWLYGVALRTAKEAKQRDGRRRRRETPAPEAVVLAATGDPGRSAAALIGREELDALHEEVARLPERYRIPLVLCELEGLTYQEVARRLECPVGTVGVRLLRARERLRARLIRRGIAPAGATALAYTCFGEGSAAVLLTPALVEATAHAAAGFVVGDAVAAGLVPVVVLALAGAVLHGMKVARLKVAAGGLLVAGLVATPGFFGAFRPSEVPIASEPMPLRLVGATMSTMGPASAIAPPAADWPVDPALLAAPASAGRQPEPGRSLASLRPVGHEEVTRGEVLFFKDWVANDPISPHGDGLGPVFNESSCVACHGLGAPGGAGPANKNVILLTASPSGGKLPGGLDQLLPGFKVAPSTVLHRYGTDPGYDAWRQEFLDGKSPKARQVQQAQRSIAGGETAEAAIGRIAQRGAGNPQGRGRFRSVQAAPGISLRVSERNSPALFGAGQIDAIPAEALVEQASWEPTQVRGRVNRSRDGRVGRFGWKAQVGGLHDFVRSACAGELGLEVPGHSQGTSPLAPLDAAKGLDLTQGDCDALVAYVRALPAPVAVDPDGPLGTADITAGRRLFAEVGCTSCHAPSLGEVRGIYSDLLLHELGPGLSDSGSYYGSSGSGLPDDPNPGEWRTPPLWGFRDSGPYLHDGRAETLEEAVALHQGQAAQVTHQFFALAVEDRTRVETFLKSLVAPSTTSAPGIVLAAELESRILPDRAREAEAVVRHERELVEAAQVQEKEDARRRQVAEDKAHRAQRNFQLAVNLERAWKTTGAIKYYREVVREAPDTEEGRVAADRIADLATRPKAADR